MPTLGRSAFRPEPGGPPANGSFPVGCAGPLPTRCGRLLTVGALGVALRDLPLPNKRWPFWCASAITVIGLPISSFVYFDALLRSGTLPPDGDSVAIPIFSSVVLALLLSPIVAATTYFVLRRERFGSTLLAWRRSQPLFSLITTILFGVPALGLVCLILEPFVDREPAIEFIWIPYTAFLAFWLLLLRAAALSSRSAPLQ